jgi:acyl phosphate:glycerol-3-phosphate acyltransferase
MDLLWVLAAYLVGSLTFGRIMGLIKRVNIAEVDTPGASGSVRQFGVGWGVLVGLGDLSKGILVAYLSQFVQWPWTVALMGMALVIGHNWPIFFGFKGGGGIAPTVGFFVFLYPAQVGAAFAFAIAFILVYWQFYWKQNRKAIYPVPVGAAAGYALALVLLAVTAMGTGFWAFLLVSVAVGLRGLQLRKSRTA